MRNEIDEYRVETRPIDPRRGRVGTLVRDVYCKGEHLPTCEFADEGFICDDRCPVEDMPGNKFVNELDELLEVAEEVDRVGWFLKKGIKWSMTRISTRRQFVNGRSRKSDIDYVRDTWFSGRTWTRWGARRQIRKHREEQR